VQELGAQQEQQVELQEMSAQQELKTPQELELQPVLRAQPEPGAPLAFGAQVAIEAQPAPERQEQAQPESVAQQGLEAQQEESLVELQHIQNQAAERPAQDEQGPAGVVDTAQQSLFGDLLDPPADPKSEAEAETPIPKGQPTQLSLF
jgi:hypothetical protein